MLPALAVFALISAAGVACAAGAVAVRVHLATRPLRRLRRRVAALRRRAGRVLPEAERRDAALAAAFGAMLDAQVRATWNGMSVDELRGPGIGDGVLRALREAGATTLGRLPRSLEAVPGIGAHRAMLLDQRIDALRRRLHDEADPDPGDPPRSPEARATAHAALAALRLGTPWARDARELGEDLADAARDLRAAPSRLRTALRAWWRDRARFDARIAAAAEAFGAQLAALEDRLDALARDETASRLPADPAARDRLATAHRAEVLDLLLDRFRRGTLHGGLAESIARAVEATPLDAPLVDARLRPYQAFGAKFVLCRKRVLLGDEMGLGKTVQAIAVAVHLSRRARPFRGVVVAPAALVENWRREIARFCRIPPVVLRGETEAGDPAVRRFATHGGLAITSYASSWRGLADALPPTLRLDLLVADEAHYAKNPESRRTQAVLALAARAEHVLLMTGTPLENHVEEMHRLVAHVQPETAEIVRRESPELELVSPSRFTELVSPAYLRRRTRDVLRELPERIAANRWVDLVGADAEAYRAAVTGGSFHDMRRRATLGADGDGGKIPLLRELVEQHALDDRKTVVFSFYLEIVDRVAAALGSRFVLTGRDAPSSRQALLDDFARTRGPAVLVGQIGAAGTGLNIQAASAVVLMEPQLKPTTESQAIARAWRMGQTRTVLVHRLLADDTIDERLEELLHAKSASIRMYADESRLKAVSPEATRHAHETDERQDASDPGGVAALAAALERKRLESA